MDGPLTSFNYTSFIDAASYVMRFNLEELLVHYIQYDQYNVSFNLMEVKGEAPAA